MQFRHAISPQPDYATIFLRCCHISQEKRKQSSHPTKEIGKEKTRKLLSRRLDWQEKGILAKVVKDTQQQLNPAVVVVCGDNFEASFPALRVWCRVLFFVIFVPVTFKFVPFFVCLGIANVSLA